MYRLATKCATKNELHLSPNTQLWRSSAASRLVNNDTVPFGVTGGLCRVPSADCTTCTCREVYGLRICGRRSAVIVNWIRGRIFYSQVEMLCSQ